MRQPRVGHINFLNCLPLTYSLYKCGYHKGLSLVSAVPSSLNRAMQKNELNISPMSSFAFGEMSEKLLMLPNLGIVSDGKVQSIILAAKKSIERLSGEKILLTAQSATSHCLLKIILRREYNCVPVYSTQKIDPLNLFANDEVADLLIGDDALYVNYHHQNGIYYYDLGAEWKKMTGLPMVYAVWAVTRSFAEKYPTQLNRVYNSIRTGFDNGIASRGKIIEMVLNKKPFSYQQLWMYFDVIKYDIGEKELLALKTFYQLAYEYNFLAKLPVCEIAALNS
ncbi:menaquinone biosynthetic enzyme MqnA/MqnD family protein [Pectinatus frisingensis]|uniref:menaquinone biosynthetic enzyme MqnA/MqnD family protein n=1 Tax=Pectinatus frisingensis TaxID=865 RepID=UPI0018C483B5|nr:menaquinone biosynthesis protein [Pectinatus frisingensis]